jgi:molybdenum cofactor guanylyltransferase
MTPPFSGAVLTGGRSRRMGADKALLEVGGGRALVTVAAEALAGAGAVEVFAVGGNPEGLAALGLRMVPDAHPDEGPLGGTITALRTAGTDLVAVLACDMPVVTSDVAAALVAALVAEPEAGVAVGGVDGRIQPPTAVWRASSTLAALEQGFASGERAPRRLLAGLDVVEVADLDPAALADVDRPEDLRRYADPVLDPRPR